MKFYKVDKKYFGKNRMTKKALIRKMNYNGMLLEYVDKNDRDKEICLAAILQNPDAIKFVKYDGEMSVTTIDYLQRVAVGLNSFTIHFCESPSYYLKEKAVKLDARTFKDLPYEDRSNIGLIELAVSQYANNLEFIDSDYESEEIILSALYAPIKEHLWTKGITIPLPIKVWNEIIERDPEEIEHIGMCLSPEDFDEDEDSFDFDLAIANLCICACKQDKKLIQWLPFNNKYNIFVRLTLIDYDPSIIEIYSREAYDEELWAALKKDPSAIKYINPDRQTIEMVRYAFYFSSPSERSSLIEKISDYLIVKLMTPETYDEKAEN